MSISGDDRRISIERDVIGSTVITGDGNIVVFQAAGLVRDYLQDRPSPDGKIGPNPYKGLLAFLEQDANWFFGREEQIERLWKLFHKLHDPPPRGKSPQRLLPVLGPSGSGKSSVARAGLVPELARRPMPGWNKARVAVMTPGSSPIAALAAVFARIVTGDSAPVRKTREFVEELKLRTGSGHCDGLQRIASALPEIASSPLVVLVDQFEEIYSLCASADERTLFVDNLLYAVSAPGANVSVIITLRTDFLDETQKHPLLNATIASQGAIIPAMNEAELRRAITEPAKLAGHPLDAATVDLLIRETEGREGALPLLQFALTRIWDGLAEGVEPADTLKEIGGVGGALAGEAQRIYDNLPDAEKKIARRVFLGLVQLGEGTRDTRRRVALAHIVAAGEDPDDVEDVVRRFAAPGVRLITLSSQADGRETAEVTHEALFEHWQQLSEWLERSRDDLRFQRRLDQAATNWADQSRAEGLLWRPPDLDLLRRFHTRAASDMSPLQVDFFIASERSEQARVAKERHRKRFLKILLGVAGTTAAIAILLLVVALNSRWDAVDSASRAKAARLAAQALDDLSQNNTDQAILRALSVAESGYSSPIELRALSKAAYSGGRTRLRLVLHQDMVSSVACSPDKEWKRALSGSRDKTIAFWDLETGKVIHRLVGHDKAVTCVAFHPVERKALSGSEDGRVIVWNLETGQMESVLELNEPINALVVSSDGSFVLAGSKSGKLTSWIPATNEKTQWDKTHSGEILSLDLSQNNQRALSSSSDGTVMLWDVKSQSPLKTFERTDSPFEGHTRKVTSAKFIPTADGSEQGNFVSTCTDGCVRMWRIEPPQNQILGRNEGHTQTNIDCLGVHPQGLYAVTGASDNQIILWDLQLGIPQQRFVAHEAPISSLAYSPDPNRSFCISGSEDGSIRVWDITHPAQTARFTVLAGPVPLATYWLGFLGKDEQVLAVTDRGTIAMEKLDGRWKYGGKVSIDQQTGMINREPRARSFAADANLQIAVAGAVQDGTATLWDLKSNKPLRTFQGVHQADEEMPAVAFSPDASQILTGSTDNTLMLWDTNSGKPVWPEPLKFSRNVWAVAFLTNDTAVVGTEKYRSEQPELALWNLKSRATIKPFQGHTDAVYAIAMSPDRKTMLSGSADRTVILWDLANGAIMRRFRGHSGPVWAVALGPQNDTILSGSEDKTVRLWDIQEGLELFRFDGHASVVCSVAYSPDGRTLVSGGADGNIIFWKRRTLNELVEWTRKNRYVPAASPQEGQALEIVAK